MSILALLLVRGGCATRPINPPLKEVDVNAGYTLQTRQKHFKSQDNLVVLAFSGGGTRAAAFSYGVQEFLRRTDVVAPNGTKARLLDAVDVITGVSGGSFTASAFGLYGDKLFADYEQRFLKHDVQGELIPRAINPAYWGDLSSMGLTVGEMEYILPNKTTYYRAGDFFFETGHISHHVNNKTGDPNTHLLFEIRPLELTGASLILPKDKPVR